MTTIGTGNTGMILASAFTKKPILFSTAHQDTINFSSFDVNTFSEDGAGKRFRTGAKIWENNFERIEEILDNVRNEKVVIFSSFGGGSGSSSLNPISRILINNNNKVLIVGIMPYKKEINPPLANSVQALNSLMPLISKVSVFIFDNEKLRKEQENNWENIDGYIIKKTDYLINLLKKYSSDDYSPLTIDQSELDSVIFGGGFVDLSDTFLEEGLPKFEYGKLDKTTKNCLISMYVDYNIKGKSRINKYQDIFTPVMDRISSRVSNARFIPGILRAKVVFSNSENKKIKDRAYITIVSGLNINHYLKKIERVRDLAMKKAMIFAENYSGSKFIDKKENKILDI